MEEVPFCIVFVATMVMLLWCMVNAFDTEKMGAVHRLLTDSVRPQATPRMVCLLIRITSPH